MHVVYTVKTISNSSRGWNTMVWEGLPSSSLHTPELIDCSCASSGGVASSHSKNSSSLSSLSLLRDDAALTILVTASWDGAPPLDDDDDEDSPVGLTRSSDWSDGRLVFGRLESFVGEDCCFRLSSLAFLRSMQQFSIYTKRTRYKVSVKRKEKQAMIKERETKKKTK